MKRWIHVCTLKEPMPIGNLHLEVAGKLAELGLPSTAPIQFREDDDRVDVSAEVEETP